MLSPLSLDVDPVATSPLPIELDLIKTHCSVDFTDQDELLVSYLFAAIDAWEGITHRSAFSREHRWTLKDFERDNNGGIWLPRGKVSAIASIAYVYDGTTTTLTGPTSSPAGDDYQEALFDSSALIIPARGNSWPSVDDDAPVPVRITYQAGYDIDALPSDILNALLFYIRTSLDDQRTDPQKTEANLRAFETMCSGYRLTRVY